MKKISIKQKQLFDFDPNTGLNIWAKNRFVLMLIALKATGAALIFDKEVRLKKAFDKAFDEAIEHRTKLLEAHSVKKKIVYMNGREEETYLIVTDVQTVIDKMNEQIDELKAAFKDEKGLKNLNEKVFKQFDEAKQKYQKLLTDDCKDDQSKSLLITKIDDREIEEKKILDQNYDVKEMDAYNKEFTAFLEEPIELDCNMVKLSKLEKEDCSSLNGVMQYLSDFIDAEQ